MEGCAVEIRNAAARVPSQRAVRRDAHAGPDLLFGRGQHARGRQPVQRAQRVGAPYRPQAER